MIGSLKLLFRFIGGTDSPPPAAGEIYIEPDSAGFPDRRDLAALVLEQGPKCLRQGAGPIECVVVAANPTLDELLAATFAIELLSGRALPAGAASFARYAALVREGHIPSKLPLESSLEGLFLAIRNADGDDLAQPDVAARFAARWQRVSQAILQAAGSGLNPFTTPLVEEGSEFAREQAFLARDHEVYRQDVERGGQWTVSIPGGPPRGRGLLLREPKSLLFKQWSRRAEYSAAGEPFVFLAVDWGSGHWVFSTDPVQRLSIKPLAELLQAAEAKCDPTAAAQDPWFDGKPFGHSLVAAPRRGSKLAEADLLTIVHRWCDAPPAPREKRLPAPRRWTAIAAGLLVLAAIGWLLHRPEAHGAARGLEFLQVDAESVNEKIDQPRTGSDYAIFFATDRYDCWPRLCNAVRDANRIADLLETRYGFKHDHIERCWGFSKDEVTGKLEEYLGKKKLGPDDQLLIYFAGHGQCVDTKGYLVAKGSLCSAAEDAKTRNSYVDLAVVRDDVEKIHAKGCGHVFLIMDTCFGGMIDFDVATEQPATRGHAPIEWTPERKDKIVRRKMRHRCCAYLTSVGKEPASDGTCGDAKTETHSPFAQGLIDLFEKPPPGGLITIPSILAALQSSQQEPCLGYLRGHESNGDFVFLSQR